MFYNERSRPTGGRVFPRRKRAYRFDRRHPESCQMLSLDTSLTNRNAATVLRDGLARLAQGEARVDCSALTQVDSAAVAVLLAWQRDAAGRGQALSFVGVPPQLAQLAALYGVDSLLELAPQAGAGAPHTASHRH
ncbi:lipid asymmetry maintenance protein MlaB [Cupriavidus sp. 2TAF22]|uniref:STAS domain-containing protein n=1 Tax=Cupriavidus sp. 2TAF22 TaxID=3233010 RepID=UPI003F8E7950